MKQGKTVDDYIEKHAEWKHILLTLRNLLRETELQEHIKWGAPVYTLDNKNLVGYSAFKNHAGLWFFQGVFLDDPDNLLVNAQEGKTKALRQLRYNIDDEVDVDVAREFIRQTITNQKSGIEIKSKRNKKLLMPKELDLVFLKNPQLKDLFFKLTPGRQREYADYINDAKRDATKQDRIEKITPMIEKGVGLNDKYR